MDGNRVVRFSVAGWAFIIFIPLHYWIIVGNLTPISDLLTTGQGVPTAVAALIVGIATSPLLGFVISTFAYRTITALSPEFIVPTRNEDFDRFTLALRRLHPSREVADTLERILQETPNDTWRNKRKLQRQLMPFFNMLVHTIAPTSFVDYSTRRWTLYWMYANSICAFVLAFLAAWIIASPPWFRPLVFDDRILVECLLLVFVGLGIYRIQQLKHEIYEIAWLWLFGHARC